MEKMKENIQILEAFTSSSSSLSSNNRNINKFLINNKTSEKWKNLQEPPPPQQKQQQQQQQAKLKQQEQQRKFVKEEEENRQRKYLIKQKSQNYFKQQKQQQQQQDLFKYLVHIYGRACCFLTTIHRTTTTIIKTTTTPTTSTSTTTTSNRKIKKSSCCNNLNLLPKLGASSFVTIFILLCLELVLLSTVSNCAKTFYMHWNTSNSIFRIDNTDHIIDVNKGNLAFEFDQVHIICPVYEPGTYENETEKYIIYNVSKVEYETCRITNPDPRVIAICDKPQKLMFFTITFRPFTPQPGGLEFLPGNDYYFISTSSKDDLYRRIGGRCSTNNMKVVFKVCCAPEENKSSTTTTTSTANSSEGENNQDEINNNNNNNHHHGGVSGGGHPHHINQHQIINNVNTALMPINGGQSGKMKPNVMTTNVEQFNRIPMQTNPTTINGNSVNVIGNNIGDVNVGTHHLGGGILLTPGHGGINMITNGGPGNLGPYGHPGVPPGGGIRINNVPMQKNHEDHRFDKHPNEVVKNEELTYNSGSWSTLMRKPFWMEAISYLLMTLMDMTTIISAGNLLKFCLLTLLLSLGYCGHKYLTTIELISKMKLNLLHYFSHIFRKSKTATTATTARSIYVAKVR